MTILFGIALKDGKREPMREVDTAEITVASGIVGDWRGGGGLMRERQVTLISRRQWEAVCKVLGANLPWTTRRANLCVDGIDCEPRDVGAHIGIGPQVVLEVTGETTSCKRMDEAHPGLKQALAATDTMWPAGVTCRVVQGGVIHVGNMVVHSDQ